MHSNKRAQFIQRGKVMSLELQPPQNIFQKDILIGMGKEPKRGGQREAGGREKKGKWIRSANQNDRLPRDF